jgi:hypothetical protein
VAGTSGGGADVTKGAALRLGVPPTIDGAVAVVCGGTLTSPDGVITEATVVGNKFLAGVCTNGATDDAAETSFDVVGVVGFGLTSTGVRAGIGVSV